MSTNSTGGPLAIEFANTRLVSRGTPVEVLDTPEALVAWVRDQMDRDLSGVAGEPELARFVELRDAVRGMAETISDGVPQRPAEVAILNAAAAAAPSWPVLEGKAVREETSADAVTAALAAIAGSAIDLFGGPHRAEVRACGRRPACIRFFLKTHPRRDYCSPECGNRARVSRHYERKHV